MDSNGFQTYDEFMSGVKRKTILPKNLRFKLPPTGYPNFTKTQFKKLVVNGVLRIDHKIPFITYNSNEQAPISGRKTDLTFEIWYKFYKKHFSCPDVEREEQETIKKEFLVFDEDKDTALNMRIRHGYFGKLLNRLKLSQLYERLAINPKVCSKNRKIYRKKSDSHYNRYYTPKRKNIGFSSWRDLALFLKELG